tara:strand:+ start:6524 stop:7048 length:525 start_codon:yes stop_codon:yes gene_type:complete
MNFGEANAWSVTFELLKGLFPNAELTQDQYDIWRDDLASMNQEDVRIAIKQHWREKSWKTPRLPEVKSIIYQIKENRQREFVSSDEDRATQEYEDQQIRLSQESMLDRLLDTPQKELSDAASVARSRYSMLLSKSSGDDPKDWSIMFRAAVIYCMDGNTHEEDGTLCKGELAQR